MFCAVTLHSLFWKMKEKTEIQCSKIIKIKKFHISGCSPLTFFLCISEGGFLLPLPFFDNWISSISFTSLLLSDEIRQATWADVGRNSQHQKWLRRYGASMPRARTGRSNHGTSVLVRTRAARCEPRGGEIPMRPNAWPEEMFPEAGALSVRGDRG